jgi:hypothetical protein
VSLDEPDVFETTLDYLSARGYEILVHVPGSHEEGAGYESILERFTTHNITIQNRRPDIICRTPTGKVIAVEVKGDSGILKALGQALVYQQGAHRTYIAAESNTLSKIDEQTQLQGIGEIRVSEQKEVTIKDPPTSATQDILSDVEGQLRYRLGTRSSVGNIARMGLTQPLNFLAPPVAMATCAINDRRNLEEAIHGLFGMRVETDAIRGARLLGLIDLDQLSLTENGDIAVSFLKGRGIQSLGDLADFKTDIDDVLHKKDKTVAAFLREQFRRHPEFDALIDVLESFSDYQVSLGQVIGRMIDEYPNVFLNLFCAEQHRAEGERLILEETAETITVEDWRPLIRQNIVHNFTMQLKHLGVLMPRTSGHPGALEEYQPTEHQWFLSNGPSWF